jgi:hypothetical protein
VNSTVFLFLRTGKEISGSRTGPDPTMIFYIFENFFLHNSTSWYKYCVVYFRLNRLGWIIMLNQSIAHFLTSLSRSMPPKSKGFRMTTFLNKSAERIGMIFYFDVKHKSCFFSLGNVAGGWNSIQHPMLLFYPLCSP